MTEIKSGYLLKRGGKLKQWRKRWFVLRQQAENYDLFYFKSDGVSVFFKGPLILKDPDPKGMIRLSDSAASFLETEIGLFCSNDRK